MNTSLCWTLCVTKQTVKELWQHVSNSLSDGAWKYVMAYMKEPEEMWIVATSVLLYSQKMPVLHWKVMKGWDRLGVMVTSKAMTFKQIKPDSGRLNNLDKFLTDRSTYIGIFIFTKMKKVSQFSTSERLNQSKHRFFSVSSQKMIVSTSVQLHPIHRRPLGLWFSIFIY